MQQIRSHGQSSAALSAIALCAALVAGVAVAQTTGADPKDQAFSYDHAVDCSKKLAAKAKLSADENRSCLIAISSTYIEWHVHHLSGDKMLLADDISRHQLSTPADYKPGNAAAVRATEPMTILNIKNRQWTADGNHAWITYDGYLKDNPNKASFWVAERFTIENGLIREIMVPAAVSPTTPMRTPQTPQR